MAQRTAKGMTQELGNRLELGWMDKEREMNGFWGPQARVQTVTVASLRVTSKVEGDARTLNETRNETTTRSSPPSYPAAQRGGESRASRGDRWEDRASGGEPCR